MAHYDLVVVGGGSGGFAAALAGARLGCKVLLLEKNDSLGGNATRGGVNTWEPGVGGTGIPFDLYKRLKKIPSAVGIYSFGRHMIWQPQSEVPRYPGGELVIDPSRTYLDTLQRFGAPENFSEEHFRREHWHGIPFEPVLYAREMEAMLEETGCCEIRTGAAFVDGIVEGRRLTALRLDNGDLVTAKFFVDGTADIHLATRLGCQTALGQESSAQYGERGAPDQPGHQVNGATLIYRVSPTLVAAVDPLPPDIPSTCWWQPYFPLAACTQYPNGDFNINSLPTMDGQEARKLQYAAAYRECKRRILAHWHYFQTTFPEFQNYRMTWIAPSLGIREGPRLVGRYVLTEHDLDTGLARQTHNDIIALADHAKDTHGASTGRIRAQEMTGPYGIPFRCLLPQEIDNLMVACRGASFSSIAASSCRLSRTMMQLGQAAGTAAAIAIRDGVDSLAELPPRTIQEALLLQNVELTWPRSRAMIRYLKDEECLWSSTPLVTT